MANSSSRPPTVGGSDSTSRKGDGLVPHRRGSFLEARENWGLPHPTGPQFAFADGSVHTVPYGTAPQVVAALRTPSGGEVVPDF